MEYSHSILSMNIMTSLRTLTKLYESGIRSFHIDLMDSCYTDYFGLDSMSIVFLINKYKDANFNIHLMVKNPERVLKCISKLGIKNIFVPALKVNEELINKYKDKGMNIGLMIEAKNDIHNFSKLIKQTKIILLMCINKIGTTGEKINLNLLKRGPVIKSINPKIILYSDGGLRKDNLVLHSKYLVDICIGGSIINNVSNKTNYKKWFDRNKSVNI